jgi:hypothetical protein
MKNPTLIILIFTFIVFTCSTYANQKQSKELRMSVTGKYEVSLEPQNDEVAPAGRMIINKKYSGGLVGVGVGQMISKRTESGTAVYSAIEEFDGSVDGKTGGFTLIHTGHMSAEGQILDVTVLNGSGTGELKSISGSLEIIQEDKEHKYVLSYVFNDELQ